MEKADATSAAGCSHSHPPPAPASAFFLVFTLVESLPITGLRKKGDLGAPAVGGYCGRLLQLVQLNPTSCQRGTREPGWQEERALGLVWLQLVSLPSQQRGLLLLIQEHLAAGWEWRMGTNSLLTPKCVALGLGGRLKGTKCVESQQAFCKS